MRYIFAFLFNSLPMTLWAEPQLGDDGLNKQPWFSQSFLELADDLSEARDDDKLLMVIVEQAGCP